MLVSIKCMKTKYTISRVEITWFKCHLTSLWPRKSVEKGILLYIWMDWCQCHLGKKKKGALYIDTQKSVKYVLGKFVD